MFRFIDCISSLWLQIQRAICKFSILTHYQHLNYLAYPFLSPNLQELGVKIASQILLTFPSRFGAGLWSTRYQMLHMTAPMHCGNKLQCFLCICWQSVAATIAILRGGLGGYGLPRFLIGSLSFFLNLPFKFI